MDVKVECESVSILCHGCLTANRRVRLVIGETRQMFYELRDDKKLDKKQHGELVLCWECMAFLRKLKIFKERIRTAQCLLMQYLQCYYINDRISNPNSLSSLDRIHSNTYNYKYYEENKKEYEITNDIELYQEENTEDNIPNDVNTTLKDEHNKEITAEDLLRGVDIKTENNESIKEEYDSSNDNDSEYYEEVLKLEPEESIDKSSKEKKITEKKYKLKRYNQFAKVTKRTDVTKKNFMQFSEPCSVDKKEYEKIMRRDRIRYGYPRMPYKCQECRTGYFQKLDLQRHNSQWHDQKFPYICAACPTEMTSLEHEDQHWADAHSTVYKCTLCCEVHQSSFEVNKHIKLTHTKSYTCKVCSLEYGSLREFKNHYKSMHENMVCDYCNNSFVKKRSLIEHMKRHHIPAYCKICNRTYRNHKTFKYHNRVSHPELMEGETRKELSYCVECDKQYPSVYKYRRHLQQSTKHTQPKKVRVPCPDCGKIFTRTNFMRNHYRLVHLKVTKHYCDQCDKYYTTGYGLRKHIERVHKKIAQPKDKICDLCGRGFGTNKILENHRRTHTGERPFKCKYCPAAFAQKTAMKTHQKSQHKC